MNISGSAKISVLDFEVLYDISTGTPRITVTNRSSGPDLSLCRWWLQVTTPSASIIHEGSYATPDETGTWATWTMPEDWPQVFYHVEWSGEPYTVTLYVNDGGSPAQLFSLSYDCEICPPPGNNGSIKSNFGIGTISPATVKCATAQVMVEDISNYLYRGMTGNLISLNWILVYPPLESGESLPNGTLSGTSYAYFGITYNATGYSVYLNVIREYVIDANNTIRLQMKSVLDFDVSCNMDLCSIVCGYEKLLDKVEKGGCADADMRNKLTLVSAKVNLALIAATSNCTGVDLSSLLNDIKKDLGDFDCGCESDGKGITVSGLI